MSTRTRQSHSETHRPATKAERRELARAHRRAAEAEERRRAQQRRRMMQLAGLVVAALVIVGGLIAIGGSGGDDPAPKAPAQTASLFDGIAQDGIALGDPDAPVTLVEVADLQCPFCAQWSNEVLPTIVDRYVRTGKVRMEMRTLAFLGPDSVRAANAAAAAAEQDRLWPFVDRFYHAQGTENSGYVTDGFLRGLAGEVQGLDARRTLTAAGGQPQQAIADAQTYADRFDISSTPSFTVGPTDGPQRLLATETLEPEEFTAALDKELAKR